MNAEIWKPVVEYEGLYEVSSRGRVKSLNYQGKKGKEGMLKLSKKKDGYLGVALTKNKKIKHLRVHRLVAEAFIPNYDNYPIINHKDENPSNNCVDNLEWCTYKYNMNYGHRTEKFKKSIKGKLAGENHPFYGKRAHNYGKALSKETKEKISKSLKGKRTGKDNPMYGKIGEKHHMYGKKYTEEEKIKMKLYEGTKVICITTGEVYTSISEAGRISNTDRTSISNCCRRKQKHAGKHPKTGEKLKWEYVDKVVSGRVKQEVKIYSYEEKR